MLVAGVDSSTQSTKVLLCEAADGTIVDQASAPHPGGTECPPQAWWEALTKAGDGLLTRAAAVGVAGQQHGMVVLDENAEVIRPALLWNDLRSAGAAEALVAERGPRWWAERTGSVPNASFTVTKLRWLAEHEPDHAARVYRVMLPHDYLTWRLLAGPADGQGAGHRPRRRVWHRVLLARRRRLAARGRRGRARPPGPAAPGGPAGRGRGRDRLGRGGVGRHRGQHGRGAGPGPGAGRDRRVDRHLRHGLRGDHRAVRRPQRRDRGLRRRHRGDSCRWSARSTPRWCSTRWRPCWARTPAGLSARALAAAPGAGGITLLPYFDGERTPVRPGATGALQGLTTRNATPENLARAAVEAVLASLADVAGLLHHDGAQAGAGPAAHWRRGPVRGGPRGGPGHLRGTRWTCRNRRSTWRSARPGRPPGRWPAPRTRRPGHAAPPSATRAPPSPASGNASPRSGTPRPAGTAGCREHMTPVTTAASGARPAASHRSAERNVSP